MASSNMHKNNCMNIVSMKLDDSHSDLLRITLEKTTYQPNLYSIVYSPPVADPVDSAS